jgi:small subunit ribosomal protein S16
MLTIRMQRLGRKGHPTYRVVVQDVRQTPTSGKNVAMLGSYDPHTKTTTLVREKAEFYLKNGAQPSDRVARLFTAEGIKLPEWVKMPTERKREIRKADKLRKHRPAEEAPAPAEEPVAEEAPETPEEPKEVTEETPVDEAKS